MAAPSSLNRSNYLVVKATLRHFPSVAVLEASRRSDLANKDYLQQSIRDCSCLVALGADEEVLGYLIFNKKFYEHPFIEKLYVRDQDRRSGVAESLMNGIEVEFPKTKIFTSTNESNVAMQTLCAKLGYKFAGKVDHLDEGDPELVYCKVLAE